MRLTDIGLEAVLGQRTGDPVFEIVPIGGVSDVLELAAAAFGKMAAGRLLVVRARLDRAVFVQLVAGRGERRIAPVGRDPVAASGDADNDFAHSQSMSACGRAST